MSSPTVTARWPVLEKMATAESTPSSSGNSLCPSPIDTPRQSASSTSLSSLSEVETMDVKKSGGKMLDTYGNEFKIPDYTINQIRNAIPAHCFERSAARGLGYVARDLASLAVTFYIFHNYVTPENIPSTPVRALLWAVYTFVQGLFGTGLWVLAHECGHQSFSPSKTLNDTVGWICHSALLVPYFSWKISHGKHHKATGHLERDMVFVPKTREQYASRIGHLAHELSELMEETPIMTAGHLIGQQLAGWLLYISLNVTGHNEHERQPEGRGKGKKNGFGGRVNHFDPASPLYEAKDSKLILLSDLGLAITISLLTFIGLKYGLANLTVWYIIPYLWVNHWLGKHPLFPTPSLPHPLTPLTPTSFPQSPSPSSNTPTPASPTTPPPPGPTRAAPPQPSTANSASSAASCCTALWKPMSCTTTSPPSPSTTPTRPPRPSSPSWACIIAPIPGVARWAS